MLNAGYHLVPPGMIATVVTSLEMFELPTLRPEAPDPNWRLDRLAGASRIAELAEAARRASALSKQKIGTFEQTQTPSRA